MTIGLRFHAFIGSHDLLEDHRGTWKKSKSSARIPLTGPAKVKQKESMDDVCRHGMHNAARVSGRMWSRYQPTMSKWIVTPALNRFLSTNWVVAPAGEACCQLSEVGRPLSRSSHLHGAIWTE